MKTKRSLKIERLRGRLERDLLTEQCASLEYSKKVRTDDAVGDVQWSERTRRDAFALKMLETAAAGVRAKQLADAGPKVFGVVAVVNRIDDHAKWEEMARAIDAGKQVIDVEALGGLHQAEVHSSRRAVGSLQTQLAGHLPTEAKEEAEAGTKEEEQGQGEEPLAAKVAG